MVATMTSSLKSAISRRLSRFAGDEDGVSAVEFAMLLPLMITLYLGSIEITQAVSSDRKMTLVAGTIGDLVARSACMTESEVSLIFDAGKAVLYPYDLAKMKMVVSHVVVDANKTATIDAATGGWSRGDNGGATRSGNVTAQIPEALRQTAGAVIWAEAYYTYVPTIGKVIAPSGIQLSEKVFLKPRMSTTVPLKGSC